MRASRIRAIALVMAVLSGLSMSGCSNGSVDSGAAPPTTAATTTQDGRATTTSGAKPLVLHLASIDEVNDNGQSYGPEAFVRELGVVSSGQLKVAFTGGYGNGTGTAESELVQAIARGSVDGGWPSVRAFHEAGIPGLDPVEAPLTLVSYAAEKALVRGPVGRAVLARLDQTPVVGLGLAVGPLRRPFGASTALTGPTSWQGRGFRVYNSPTQAATVRALGGRPESLGFSQIRAAVLSGRVGGSESDVAQALANRADPALSHVTRNVVLWPKVFVLSLSRGVFDGLTPQQQGWVRLAARRASRASVRARYNDNASARSLCHQGYTFDSATPAQLAQLQRDVRPVTRALARSRADRALLIRIQRLAARYPSADVLRVPHRCSLRGHAGPVSAPSTPSTLPDGTYQVTNSDADVVAAHMTNEFGLTGRWSLLVRNGTFQLTCRPVILPGADCGTEITKDVLEAGVLRGTGDHVSFVSRARMLHDLTGCSLPASNFTSGACYEGGTYTMTWRLTGDQLTFSHYVSSSGPDPQYLVKPWTKLG